MKNEPQEEKTAENERKRLDILTLKINRKTWSPEIFNAEILTTVGGCWSAAD